MSRSTVVTRVLVSLQGALEMIQVPDFGIDGVFFGGGRMRLAVEGGQVSEERSDGQPLWRRRWTRATSGSDPRHHEEIDMGHVEPGFCQVKTT